VGATSTVAYVALFVLLALVLPPLAANAVALGACTVASRAGRGRGSLIGSVLAFAATLGLSSALLLAGTWAFSGAGAGTWLWQVASLIVASATVAAGRFLLLQGLAYHHHLRRQETA
jgi:hypothetical protein